MSELSQRPLCPLGLLPEMPGIIASFSPLQRASISSVVVAQWIYWERFITGGQRLKVMETTTDAAGRYELPSWGPRLRRPFAFLDYLDPELLIFKHQYDPLQLFNEQPRNSIVRFSEWDGQTLQLRPFQFTFAPDPTVSDYTVVFRGTLGLESGPWPRRTRGCHRCRLYT
jgi:hypothetical protein